MLNYIESTRIGAGIHDLPSDIYHGDPCSRPSLSSSLAKTLLSNSPRHAWVASPRLNPNWQSTDRKAFDIGRAAHSAVLGKGGEYLAYPAELLASNGAASTKEAKAWALQVRADGNTPLKADEVEVIDAMASALKERLALMNITFDPARSELTAIAEIDGVMCRAMIDNVPADPKAPIYDFKTCESAAPEACMKSIINYGYDVQAAHYVDTWHAATGEMRKFRFVFQEKASPNEICVIEIGNDSLMMGRRKIARAREIWRECEKTNIWPGYPLGVQVLELPEWFHNKWLDRETRELDQKQTPTPYAIDAAIRWQSPDIFTEV